MNNACIFGRGELGTELSITLHPRLLTQLQVGTVSQVSGSLGFYNKTFTRRWAPVLRNCDKVQARPVKNQ
jgi:hypothetical protein